MSMLPILDLQAGDPISNDVATREGIQHNEVLPSAAIQQKEIEEGKCT